MNEKESARLFASMGGKARAKKLSKKRRVEIARAGGQAKSNNRRALKPKDGDAI
jgi:general stress protein YciG